MRVHSLTGDRELVDPAREGYPFVHQIIREVTREGGWTLEIGCGPGQYRTSVAGPYVGMDIVAGPYKEGVPRRTDVVADALNLPFHDAAFDTVFSVGVFDQLRDLRRAVAESVRVTKPRGRILVVTYTWQALQRLRNRDQAHQVFTAAHLESLFRSHGLVIRFRHADEPRTPWKRWLSRLAAFRLLRRYIGTWLVVVAERPG